MKKWSTKQLLFLLDSNFGRDIFSKMAPRSVSLINSVASNAPDILFLGFIERGITATKIPIYIVKGSMHNINSQKYYWHDWLFQCPDPHFSNQTETGTIYIYTHHILISRSTLPNSPFRELAARGTSTNQIAASWMLQATWLATVASCHVVRQTLLTSL